MTGFEPLIGAATAGLAGLISGLVKEIRSQRNISQFQTKQLSGIHLANELLYLMVLGGPGVGNSTFLRKVGLEALRALGRKTFAPSAHSNKFVPQQVYYKHSLIPVMLELRQFSQSNLSIESKIAEELETCGFPKAKE